MTNYKCRCFRCSTVFSPNEFHITREDRVSNFATEDGSIKEVISTKSESYACPKCLCDGFDYVFQCPFCGKYHSTDEFINNVVCIDCYKKQSRSIEHFINYIFQIKDYKKLEIYFHCIGGKYDFAKLIADALMSNLKAEQLESIKYMQEVIVDNEYKENYSQYYFGTKEIIKED